MKREEEGTKREEPFKMKRFQNVESRLHEDSKSTFALGRTLDPTTVSKLPRGLTEKEPKPVAQKAPTVGVAATRGRLGASQLGSLAGGAPSEVAAGIPARQRRSMTSDKQSSTAFRSAAKSIVTGNTEALRHMVHNVEEEDKINYRPKHPNQDESIFALVAGGDEPVALPSAKSPISPRRAKLPRGPADMPVEELKRKEAVPRASEQAQLAPRQDKNYLRDNIKSVVEGGETRTIVSGATKFTVGGEEGMHKNYGRVPRYINKMNQARADEAERRRVEEEQAKLCPPGTKPMPDEERLATLE